MQTCGTCKYFKYEVYNDRDGFVYPQPICDLKNILLIDIGNRDKPEYCRENKLGNCSRFILKEK